MEAVVVAADAVEVAVGDAEVNGPGDRIKAVVTNKVNSDDTKHALRICVFIGCLY